MTPQDQTPTQAAPTQTSPVPDPQHQSTTAQDIQDLKGLMVQNQAVKLVGEALTSHGLDFNALLDQALNKLVGKMKNQAEAAIVLAVIHELASDLIAFEDQHQPKTRVGRIIHAILSFFAPHHS